MYANNLYGWAMSQKLPIDDFEWKKMSKFNEKFIKNCDENSDIQYILETDAEYPKKLHNLLNDLPFFTRTNENSKMQQACMQSLR